LGEGVWGFTPGKYVVRLRVCPVGGSSAPGLVRASLRAAVFHLLFNLGSVGWVTFWLVLVPSDTSLVEFARQHPFAHLLLSFSGPLGMALGLGVALVPMRGRNGYRGLHEWLSGTRTVSLPPRADGRTLRGPRPTWHLVHPPGCP